MEEEDEAILKLLDTLDSYISAMASLTSSLRQVRFRYTFFCSSLNFYFKSAIYFSQPMQFFQLSLHPKNILLREKIMEWKFLSHYSQR